MTSDPLPTNAPPSKETWGEAHGHAVIQRLVHELAAEEAPAGIKQRLVALETLLVAHFEGEEAAGGWFEETLEASPNSASRIEALKAEHVEISGNLDALISLINDLLAHKERVASAKAELVALIAAHDAAEHQLCLDTMFIDYGGG